MPAAAVLAAVCESAGLALLCYLGAFAIIRGVERHRLKSRAVVSAGYDAETLELELEFRSGHLYRYADVPASVYAWLLRIENKGAFVRRMIQGRYVERALPRSVILGGPEHDLLQPDALEDTLRASLDRLGKPIP